MDKRIEQLVEMMFEDIPYSDEVSNAQEKIKIALNEELDKSDKPTDKAFEDIVVKFGRLSDMAELAGYSSETSQKWKSVDETKDIVQLKKELRRQRRRIYLSSFFAIIGLVQSFWIFYQLFTKPIWAFFNIIYTVAFFLLAFIFFNKFRKIEKSAKGTKYESKSYRYLQILSDKYKKRQINCISLLFAVIFIFFFSEGSFYIFGNSKSAEFVESVFANIIIIEIPLFLHIKNLLFLKLLRNRIKIPHEQKYKRHLLGIMIFSASYWLIVTALTVIFRKSLHYPANFFLIAGILFIMIMLIYNLTLRKNVTHKNLVINKSRIAVFTVVAVSISGFTLMRKDTWYTQTYINSIPVVEHNENKIDYNEESGVYTITSSTEDFKILHLTDIHIGGSLYSYHKDIKALETCYAEIEYTHPDLVIVTGDLCFPMGIMSMSLNNTAPVYQFAAFMRNIDIPWAFTYGNHDTESLASANKNELNDVYKSLSYKSSRNLLYPYVQPNITGRNNQLIEVRNSDGQLNTALFLIDSNAYMGESINVYDYIHDDQVDWYANEIERLSSEEGHNINSMAFFHIPLQEYRTAYELYENSSDEVTYFFGENGEKMINKVCCSDYPSKLFDRMVELGSTTGVFCGHDHYNNMSLEYKGIRLTYGMSIDYLAMPGIENDSEQRGAELITLHPDSSWDLVQIPFTGID